MGSRGRGLKLLGLTAQMEGVSGCYSKEAPQGRGQAQGLHTLLPRPRPVPDLPVTPSVWLEEEA